MLSSDRVSILFFRVMVIELALLAVVALLANAFCDVGVSVMLYCAMFGAVIATAILEMVLSGIAMDHENRELFGGKRCKK